MGLMALVELIVELKARALKRGILVLAVVGFGVGVATILSLVNR